ncbi:MAG: BON domain-containing protein [Thermodesulfobacteriota bacterium]
MKKLFSIMVTFVLLAMVSGCTTIYKTAVDERSVGQIASDTKIKASIVNSFREDDTMKALDFFVGVYYGEVYLVGAYKSIAQRDRAIKIAKETENVHGVSTYILPAKKDHPCTTKVNLAITGKVMGRLIKDTDVWSTNIDVKTVQCNVVLVGLVGSTTEVNKAIAHAKSVEGVRKVKSFLKTSKEKE